MINSNNFKINNVKITQIVLCLLSIIAALIFAWKDIGYTYYLDGNKQSVSLNSIFNINDADFDFSTGVYQVTGIDPNFEIPAVDYALDGFEITIDEVSSEDLCFELFYTQDMSKGFSATKKIPGVIKKGASSGYVVVPSNRDYSAGGFRFDIDDDISIKKLESFNGRVIKSYFATQIFIFRFIVLSILFVILSVFVILPAHIERIEKNRHPIKGLFTDDLNYKPHFYEYDWMRVTASFFVIMCHAVSYELDPSKMSGGRGAMILKNIYLIGLCCNMLYVLLSGALLLQPRKDGVLEFYLHRMGKILLPLTIFYTIFSYMNGFFKDGILTGIGSTFVQIIQGAPDYAPNFWLIYVLLGLYVFAPFLRIMLKNMTEKQIAGLAVLIFALNIFESYMPTYGLHFGLPTPLTGWVGAFIFGYFLTTEISKKYDYIFLGGFVLGIFMQILMSTFAPAQANEAAGCLTTTYLLACGFFVLYRHVKFLFGRKNPVIAFLSKYSYSVILIHWYIYFVQVQGVYDWDNKFSKLTAAYISGVLLTLVICYAFAFIFDNTVIIGAQYLLSKIAKYVNIIHYGKKKTN